MSISIATSPDGIYPSSDGKPMAETGIHVLVMLFLHQMLRRWFSDREDVYVAVNMFLYYAEGKPKKRRSPDVMVNKGVKGNHERRSFKTWVEGVVPACIIEITSKKTAREDLQAKKRLYRQLGVREYILFDPLHDYLPQQLIGYRLVGKKYQKIDPGPDNGIVSKELGLRLLSEGIHLGLYDGKTGERLLNPNDLSKSWAEAQKNLELQTRNLELQTKNLELQTKNLEQERRRTAELEAELARLKARNHGKA